MNLKAALKDVVAISFSGRVNRTVFWIGQLFWLAVLVGLMFVVSRTIRDGDQIQTGITGTLMLAFFALREIAGLSLFVRRWHDRNKSGWWHLVGLIPFIGPLWILGECGLQAGTSCNSSHWRSSPTCPLSCCIRSNCAHAVIF